MSWQVERIDDPKLGVNQLDDSTFICRYFDLPEFLGILNNKLKFTSLSKLREHDAYEFNLDPSNLVVDEKKRTDSTPSSEEINELVKNKEWSKNWFCLCFCSNKIENMALWKIFASMGRGIRIDTDVGSLRRCIIKDYWPPAVYAHEVKYEYKNTASSIYDAIYTKRKEFEYESEIRLSTFVTHHHENNFLTIPIKSEELIKKIVIGPQISWAYADIVSVVKKSGFNSSLVSESRYITDRE